jgi:RNA polymerase sigma-70 factor, ECF subfamily
MISRKAFTDPDSKIVEKAHETVPSSGNPALTQDSCKEKIEKEVIDLLHKYSASLSRYAATITRDRGIAQDGIQEVFLRYFLMRAHGQQIENIRGWLFRVLRNYLVDCKRKDSPGPSVGLESAAKVIDFSQDLETALQQHENFINALSELSPREQECIQLRLEGFGYEEIAHMLEIRSGTVSALLARALRKLRGSNLFKGSPK